MTVAELNTAIIEKKRIFLIDVREVDEYMRLNIGGNRMNLQELKANIEPLKRLHTEGGYEIVLGCVYHDSKRIPEFVKVLQANGIKAKVMASSRATGGGIVAYANRFGRRIPVPKIPLNN